MLRHLVLIFLIVISANLIASEVPLTVESERPKLAVGPENNEEKPNGEEFNDLKTEASHWGGYGGHGWGGQGWGGQGWGGRGYYGGGYWPNQGYYSGGHWGGRGHHRGWGYGGRYWG